MKNNYNYRSKNNRLDFDRGVEILKKKLKNNIFTGWPSTEWSLEEAKIMNVKLQKAGIETQTLELRKKDYMEYLDKAQYKKLYPHYYVDNFYEKTLEHFISFKFLDLKEGQNLIDIASENSPASEIFGKLTKCNAYSQDIMYEEGIHCNRIGGNASELPVADVSFHAAIATCSIEHFEGDTDINFMREIERILKKGGKVVIVPLYMYTKYCCVTDPKYSIPGDVNFEEDVEIYCVESFNNRHGRFYSPEKLYERLIKPNKKINFKVYILENLHDIESSLYCRFILVGEKI